MLQAQPVLCGISKLLFVNEESPEEKKVEGRREGGKKEWTVRKFIGITDKK